MNMNTVSRSAIGFLELKGAAYGVTAVDVTVKAAPIEILQAKVACPGKFMVLLAGEMAAVETAVAAARAQVGSGLYDYCILGRIHPALYRGLHDQFTDRLQEQSELSRGNHEALGVVETLSIASGLASADIGLKSAAVTLKELRLGYALGGRSFFVFAGNTGDVEAALASAVKVAVRRGSLGSQCLIARPAERLKRLFPDSQF
jgi:microcompartment protein CcmL/EutN